MIITAAARFIDEPNSPMMHAETVMPSTTPSSALVQRSSLYPAKQISRKTASKIIFSGTPANIDAAVCAAISNALLMVNSMLL